MTGIVRNNQIAILYGTDDCHLCEQAQKVLTDADFPFDYIDIAIHEQLILEFGTKIPVVLFQGAYFNWPFSITEDAGQKHITQLNHNNVTEY